METYDSQLGKIAVHTNVRAKRFIFRTKDGSLHVTMPPGTTELQLRQSIERIRPKLEQMMKRAEKRAATRMLTPAFCIDKPHIGFHSYADSTNVKMIATPDGLELHYPPTHNWNNDHFRQWAQKLIEERLRQHAVEYLVPRLLALANERNLHLTGVNVRKTKTRWGSCSSKGTISLSLYLALLPVHLQDYVMHHELTHLLEFNHSPGFWQILDRCVNGRNEELKNEMKRYDTSIFCLANLH